MPYARTLNGCRRSSSNRFRHVSDTVYSIRQVDLDDNLRIWRSFKMGKLFDLIMLDTRNYDRSITTLNWNDDYIEELKDDAGRSLMGSHQEHWFYNQLTESHERGATWRIVGNQIIFSRMNNSAVYTNELNADQWDVRGSLPRS